MNLKTLFQRYLSLIVGCIVTLLWLGGFCYADGLSWEAFESLALNEKGDFLAGLFAPLAFFWLVLGYYQQGKELRLQAKELNESVKAQTRQAESVEANTRHAARDVFLQFVGGLFDELVARSVEISRVGNLAHIAATALRDYNNANLFFLRLSTSLQQTQNITTYKTILTANREHAQDFQRYTITFDLILAEANRADPQGELTKYYEQSSAGQLYQVIKAHFSEFL